MCSPDYLCSYYAQEQVSYKSYIHIHEKNYFPEDVFQPLQLDTGFSLLK